MKNNIELEDIKFPKDFKFEKTTNGFKINSTGGEFFPNKYALKICFSFASIVAVLFMFSFPYLKRMLINYISPYNKNYFHPVTDILIILACVFVSFFILGEILVYLLKITNVPTEYFFSSSGLNISSKKGSLFISKDNIDKIYSKDEKVETKNGRYIRYCVFFEFKTPVYIPYIEKNLEKVNLFTDSIFKDKNISLFLEQEIKILFGFPIEKIELNHKGK